MVERVGVECLGVRECWRALVSVGEWLSVGES